MITITPTVNYNTNFRAAKTPEEIRAAVQNLKTIAEKTQLIQEDTIIPKNNKSRVPKFLIAMLSFWGLWNAKQKQDNSINVTQDYINFTVTLLKANKLDSFKKYIDKKPEILLRYWQQRSYGCLGSLIIDDINNNPSYLIYAANKLAELAKIPKYRDCVSSIINDEDSTKTLLTQVNGSAEAFLTITSIPSFQFKNVYLETAIEHKDNTYIDLTSFIEFLINKKIDS